MKCKVELYVAGTVFYETVYARDYKEARVVDTVFKQGQPAISIIRR